MAMDPIDLRYVRQGKHPERAPDVKDRYGWYWRVDISAWLRVRGEPGTEHKYSMIGGWLVLCPWAHPVWAYHLLTVMHLRQMPDNPPVKIYEDGATHELHVMAINPAADLDDWMRTGRWVHGGLEYAIMLTPTNFAAQMTMPDDAAAVARIEQTAGLIVTGRMNPDTDALSSWVAMFGDNLIKDEYKVRPKTGGGRL